MRCLARSFLFICPPHARTAAATAAAAEESAVEGDERPRMDRLRGYVESMRSRWLVSSISCCFPRLPAQSEPDVQGGSPTIIDGRT